MFQLLFTCDGVANISKRLEVNEIVRLVFPGKTLSLTQLMLSDSAPEKVCDSGVEYAGIAGHEVHAINHACGHCVISPKNIPASPISVIPGGGPTVFVGRESRDLSSFARMMRI